MAPEKVGISPQGDLFPVASNDEADGRYLNRRMEILVIPHAKDDLYSTRRAPK